MPVPHRLHPPMIHWAEAEGETSREAEVLAAAAGEAAVIRPHARQTTYSVRAAAGAVVKPAVVKAVAGVVLLHRIIYLRPVSPI